MRRLHLFSDALKARFVNGTLSEASNPQPLPLHVGNPEASIFKTISEAAFAELSSKDILEMLAVSCIVVTDRPVQQIKFDAKGLSTLSTLSTVVPIQGILLPLIPAY